MNPTILALRAVTGVYFRRLLIIATAVAVGLFSILYIVINYLAMNLSPWWWIFMIVLVPLSIIVVIVGAGLWFASRKLLPRRMSRQESRTIMAFGAKLFGVIERGRVPYPLLLGMVAKDVLRGKESNLVKDTIADSRSLKDDFIRIQQMFT